MSAQEEALRKMLQELQTSAIATARALNTTRTMIVAKERERKLNSLTKNELSGLDEKKGEKVYKGVGKM